MEKGLPTVLALEKLQETGRNEIVAANKFSAVSLFLSQFPNLINAVLLLGALFSFLINDPIDGAFILAILLINAVFGFFQEYRAEKSLEKLKSFITQTSRVIRDGRQQQIETSLLVPGDVVVLSQGDRIPADGTILVAKHIETDESILSGESLPVVKSRGDSVFSGTLVAKGGATIRVETTGMNTKFGKIAATLASVKPDKTPLQQRLTWLGKVVSFIAVTIAGLMIPIGILRGHPLVELVLISVSAAIAAIPEGLPAVVTIALAIGTNRMAKKKAIVRKMPVIEALGAVQVILIDKTGTITQNAMRVKQNFFANKTAQLHMIMASLLGNTASLVTQADGDFDVIGDKTDAALLLWANEKDALGKEAVAQGEIIEEFPFDPDTKTITTVWRKKETIFVFIRGAPEEILKKSNALATERKEIEAHFDRYAKEGLRVIGFGMREVKSTAPTKRDELEQGLTFLGVVGIYDPPRKEAKDAVMEAKKAGIRIVMVTGDNELTALTIAKEVGLIEKDEDVITGEELTKMSETELLSIIEQTRVFARTAPEQKLRLVEAFKKKGFIVGVTGDGVNDSLALKRSDVGIAMGQTGTDVAKEASDIILTDDNFATLIKAVEEGRTIYKNILTSITYLLTGNLSELSLIFFSSVMGLPPPLHATQILWVNIVTDGLPALALAADVKDRSVLHRGPRDPTAPLLSRGNLFMIVLVGLSIGISLIITFMLLLQTNSPSYSRMFIFNALLFAHLIMVFAIRGKSIFRMNKFLLFSILISILAQLLVNYLPIFRVVFDI